MDALKLSESMLDKMTELVKTLGIFAVIVILLILAIYFLPTIISLVRDIKFKIPIIIVNIVTVFIAFKKIGISLIVWLILVILSLVGKNNVKTKEFPDIIINMKK